MSITIQASGATSFSVAADGWEHHDLLRAELGGLDRLAERAAGHSGDRHPELLDVLADVRELRDELEPHFLREQRMFAASGEADLAPAVAARRREHLAVVAALDRLRSHARGFRVPNDASADHSALYAGLSTIDGATRELLDEEHAVIFPSLISTTQETRR